MEFSEMDEMNTSVIEEALSVNCCESPDNRSELTMQLGGRCSSDEETTLLCGLNGVARKRKGVLTLPETPLLMKHQPRFRKEEHLTAEERELNKIKQLKSQMARKKLDAAKLRHVIANSKAVEPQKKALTRPIGFSFATDNATKNIDLSHKEYSEIDFVKSLRQQQDFDFNPGRTVPVPFVFHGKDGEEKKPSEKFETLAEQCARFTSKTPKRFHTISRKEMEKSGFGDVSYRAGDADGTHRFCAKPVPRNILEGPVGLKPRKDIPVTVPQSPAFSKMHSPRKMEPKVNNINTGIKICPLPSSTVPFKPQIEHRKVEANPFSFESRDKEMMQRKEEKIKKVLQAEKDAREFRAQLLPCSEVDLPAKKVRMITVPQPFEFEGDRIAAAQHEKWQKKLEEEKMIAKENATFRARRATVLHMQPFEPEKPSLRESVREGFIHVPTNLEKRVEAWKDMDKYLQDKQNLREGYMKESEARRKAKEEEEVKKIREQAVYKAQPIRHFAPIHVKPSSNLLTKPQTPNFSKRLTDRFRKD